MTEGQVLASPYKIGSSVSSVELLLQARTAADSAIKLASSQLGAAMRLDNPLVVSGVLPGPAHSGGAIRFVAEAKSGRLGSLLVQASTVAALADVIMGGRGVAGTGEPSTLELDLFAQRFLPSVAVLLDAVAPGRPDAVALIARDAPTEARSVVVELTLELGEQTHDFLLEVLAHHVADGASADESDAAQAVCREVPMELTFRFPPVLLAAGDVASLSPGDVICLEQDLDSSLVGEVGGKALMSARAGTSRQQAAVEVLDLIDGSE